MVKKLSKYQQMREHAQGLLDERALPAEGGEARWRKFLNFWGLVWRSFTRNRCPVRASALAYGTLLALIPMLAVVMSITSTFLKKEGEDRIDQFIVNLVSTVTPPAELNTNPPAVGFANFRESDSTNAQSSGAFETASAPTHPDRSSASGGRRDPSSLAAFAQDEQAVRARKEIAKRINEFIQNTQSGALGVTGSVLLIFAAISMLSRIEDTFNDIWGVARGRSWFMRIVLYWGVLSLAPLLVVVAVGLATGPHLEATRTFVSTLPVIGNFLLHFGFQVMPIVVLCLTFSAFYMLMPNTRVCWSAALVGGLAGGVLFHLNNAVSVLYVSRVVSNSKIYGSLGLVPVFVIGLYLSWLILLFGAQVAYAWQNRATYLEEKQVENINQRGREFVALRLMTRIGQCFARGEPASGVADLAEELSVPTRLIRQIMQTLVAARLVVETAGTETSYLPARPLETITCHDILLAMRASQGRELATRDEPTRTEVYGEFRRIQDAERLAASSVTMLALVNRAQAPLPHPVLPAQTSDEAKTA